MRPEQSVMVQAAEALMQEVDGLMPRIRPYASNAADHLERAVESVQFNIGEGFGAFPPRIKVAAYEVAKKEASEARAVLRRVMIKGVLTEHDIDRAYNLAGALVGMLTRAILTLQKRDRPR